MTPRVIAALELQVVADSGDRDLPNRVDTCRLFQPLPRHQPPLAGVAVQANWSTPGGIAPHRFPAKSSPVPRTRGFGIPGRVALKVDQAAEPDFSASFFA